jgi:flagellar biosynthetic protein FliP
LSVSPSLLILMTSFTRIAVVLALARNAIGVPSVPPNQVLIGMALFLTFFVMAPTFKQMNDQGIQPMLAGQISQQEGIQRASGPLKSYMLAQTRKDELAMFVDVAGENPETKEDVSFTSLIPAYIISELKTAFIIGFAIYVPFLVIDIIIASSLMSMGMMMIPPQMISLPFKLMLFVLVDGWSLLTRSLLTSFN